MLTSSASTGEAFVTVMRNVIVRPSTAVVGVAGLRTLRSTNGAGGGGGVGGGGAAWRSCARSGRPTGRAAATDSVAWAQVADSKASTVAVGPAAASAVGSGGVP